MKTYNEYTQEIETILNSKDYLDIYKEQCEIEILESYIENQLYLREYTNDHYIDESKLQMYIEASSEKSLTLVQKIFNFTNTILSRIWKLITGVFTWVINGCKKLIGILSTQNLKAAFDKVRNLFNTNNQQKNESTIYTEAEANSELKQIHDMFNNQYKTYQDLLSNFQQSVKANKKNSNNVNSLSFEVNEVPILDLFNSNQDNNFNANLNKLVNSKNDEIFFTFKTKNPQDFKIISIDNYDELTKKILKSVDDVKLSLNSLNYVAGIILSKVVESFTGIPNTGDLSNIAKNYAINVNNDYETWLKIYCLVSSIIGINLILPGIPTLASIIGVKVVKNISEQALKFTVSMIGNSAINYDFNSVSVPVINFNLEELTDKISDNTSKLKTDLDKCVKLATKLAGEMINDPEIKKNGEIVANLVEKNSWIKNSCQKIIAESNTLTQIPAKIWEKILILFKKNENACRLVRSNNMQILRKAYFSIKSYTDLLTNMMTIVTFSINVQDMIVKAINGTSNNQNQ